MIGTYPSEKTEKTEYRKTYGLSRDDRGAAMIVVTCVLMVVSVLCLTLVMAAYQMYSGANDEGRDEMYFRQTLSFSEVLKENLTAAIPPGNDSPSELVNHIDQFWGSTDEKEVLCGTADKDGLYELDIILDKTQSHGCIVITVNCVENGEVVASCKSKYRVSGSGAHYDYEFREYY